MRFISHLHRRTAMLWMLLVAFILSACGALIQEAPGGAPIQATPGSAPTQEATGSAPTQEVSGGAPIQATPGGAPTQEVPGGVPTQEVPGGALTQEASGGAPTQEAFMLRANPARTGVFPSDGPTTISNKLVWYIPQDLAVAGGVVYGRGYDGHFYATDVRTGQELKWSFKPDGAVFGVPTVADGVVYFGSLREGDLRDGRLYALDARTGQEKWSFRTDGAVGFSPAVAGGGSMSRVVTVGFTRLTPGPVRRSGVSKPVVRSLTSRRLRTGWSM